MPKRTNDFQSMIALIERQLAPKGARVTESKLLRDQREGEEREIDILIEIEIGDHPIKIGVECINQGRPASVEWIDKILGKYRNLPINKVVAVSQSGFTKSALKKATGANIETLTLKEGAKTDWLAIIQKLNTIKLESFLLPYPVGVTVNFIAGSSSSIEFDVQQTVLYTPTNIPRGTLKEIADQLLTAPGVIKTIQEKAFTDSGTEVEIGLRFAKGSYILDSMESKQEVHSLLIKARCKKKVSAVIMKHGSYGHAQVAVGGGETFGKPITFAFVEQRGGTPTSSLSISGIKKHTSSAVKDSCDKTE